MLYGIETDLAGAAGTPGNLDNLALSSLTLLADTAQGLSDALRRSAPELFRLVCRGVSNATFYENAMIAHLGQIDSLEKPAVVADLLLRFDKVQWVLVTAVHEGSLLLSLRTSSPKASAGDVMRPAGAHNRRGWRTPHESGRAIRLENGTPTEIKRVRATVKRRLLRALKIRMSRGQKLVPRTDV